MSDIFISYASEDRARAKVLAGALEHKKWSVWWDREILPGGQFSQIIEEEIGNAKCVIVLWSETSVGSKWVRNEAREGARREILVPALIDDVEISLEFSGTNAANLVDWRGRSPHPEFDRLLKAVSVIVGQPSLPKQSEPTPDALDHSKPTGLETVTAWSKNQKTKMIAAICIVIFIVIISIGVFFKHSQPKTPSALKTYSLTATAMDGSVTKSPDQASYNNGETVTLEAVANKGYGFTNWSGDLSGSTNPATLVMNADKSVTASFASLTATPKDGSVTKRPDQASYNNGETVTSEAVANKGSTSNESLFGPQDISKLHADADNGDAQASYYLSQRYFVGAGVDPDKEKAIKYLEKSAVAGFPPAQNELGVWLQKEEYPGGIDLERSFEWLKKAADNKDAAGTYHFGVLYLNGIYVDPDDKKAAHWIKKAAELGYSTAQASLAQMYAAAQGLPKDLELARYWYSKAANQGNIRAKGELGIYLVTGRGGEKDFGKGFKLLKEAAESNDKEAQYNLAVIYRQGMGGIEIDNERSFEWLKRSANLGHVSAQTLLGASYKVGIGTRIDIYKAEEWTTLAAEAGDAQAQYNMSILQVDKNNFPDAIKWVRLSAEQGYEPAIELLKKLGD